MLRWLFRKQSNRDQFGQPDRSEGNADFSRIVTTAAESSPESGGRTANGEVIGPFVVSAEEAHPSGLIPRARIAERAYEIWIRNGRPTGTAEQDWQQAIRELSHERAPTIP